MRRTLITFGVAVVLVVILAEGFSRFVSHPTDQEMLGIFRDRQTQLAAAVMTIRAGGDSFLGDLKDSTTTSIDPRTLGARSICLWGNGVVAFYYSRHIGSVKGIAFWPAKVRPKDDWAIVNDLDSGFKKAGTYLKPINGDWCVFLYVMD